MLTEKFYLKASGNLAVIKYMQIYLHINKFHTKEELKTIRKLNDLVTLFKTVGFFLESSKLLILIGMGRRS